MCSTCLVPLNFHSDSLERNEHGNWAAACYSCDWFYPTTNLNFGSWMRVVADAILRLTRVSATGYELRLVLSNVRLEFRRLDKSCGYFYPAVDSSSGDWIQVAADSILRLTRVSAAEYELRLIVSCGWLEFRRLETSCGWFHHTADSSSAGWIGVVADSITRLTRVPAAGHELRLIPSYCYFEFRWLDTSNSWFHPAAGYELQLFYLVADSRSAGWIRHAADIYFNISSNFKDWFCKRHHFYNLFSICWF